MDNIFGKIKGFIILRSKVMNTKNAKHSFDLKYEENIEFMESVTRSGLSKTDFIKKCVLPSKGCRIIFLDGVDILCKLTELYNYTLAHPEQSEEFALIADELFEEFEKIYSAIKEVS